MNKIQSQGKYAVSSISKLFKIARVFSRRAFAAYRTTHHHIAKRPHNYLMSRFDRYARWHNWQWHGHVHAGAAIIGVLAMTLTLNSMVQQVSALSSWAQNDWSGGQGSSNTTQFASATNVDTSTASSMHLTKTTNWFNDSWAHRRKVTFDNTDANLGATSENLTNFPVLIKLTSSQIDYAQTQNQGQDLRFTDPSAPTVSLAYEIEKWDESGTSYVWVKVPQIDSASNTDYIYMYCGNTAASDSQSKNATWNGDYKGVYHFSETSGNHNDSTANNNNSSSVSASPQGSAVGIAAGADNLNGSNNVTVVPHSSSISVTGSTLTLEAWISAASCGPANAFIHKDNQFTIALLNQGGSNCAISYADGSYWSYASFGAYGNIVANDTLHHVVAVKNGTTVTLYLDGAILVTRTGFGGAISDTSNELLLGSYLTSYPHHGRLDEARISDKAFTSAWIAATYKTETSGFASYASQESEYPSSGSLTSNIFDTTMPSNWNNITYAATVPTGSALTVKVRSGNQADLSDAGAFSGCSHLTSGSDITSACAPDAKRYAQYEITLTATNRAITPDVQSVSIGYSPSDVTAPTTNASNISMRVSSAGSVITENAWTNVTNPYFSWTAGADNSGGSGIKGYCLYLGHDSTADPISTKGLLGSSPTTPTSGCSFIVAGTSLDLTTSGLLGLALTTSNDAYYLIAKAIDNSGNVYQGTAVAFHFRFDNTPPTAPSFITAPSQFIATKQVTLTWPNSGGDAAQDTTSGLAGLQYRIGGGGTWYGDTHTGASDLTDLLADDGSYTTISNPDFGNLNDGNNIVTFRSVDNAGNTSTAYVTTVIKINSSSPSSPRNVNATPPTNSTNAFAFSWIAPASFTGSAGNLKYCYSVNATPTSSNCTYTEAGVTSLASGAYATQPGDNTFYVVTKDEAGNINYATAASTVFAANTSAPSLPLSLEIADVSNKATSTWKLALSWNAPADIGAGISSYKVYRSTDGNSFTQTASTAGASYVDNGLTNTATYYYKVKACDSASNCGAFSSIVSKLPTGRFTTPADLISQPSTQVSTRSASISWTTDRASDSRIQYGTASGQYLATEAASSESTKVHTIDLDNLSAGTTYYFKARWIDEDGNAGTSTELSFTTQPAPAIKNVRVLRTTLSSAVIQFTSSNATKIKLFFGKGESFGGLKEINTSRTESTYTVELDGLDDGATYFYKLNPIDTDGNEYNSTQQDSFATPQRPRISNLRFQPVTDKPTSTQLVTWNTNVASSSLVRYSAEGIGATEVIDSKLLTDHQLTIEGLLDDTTYTLTAESRDQDGNLALSDATSFRTALDTRPPAINGLNVQTSIRGNGSDARGQIIVAWKTDEPASSQVAYRVGKGSEYTSKTAEDTKLTTDHVVVISDLTPSNVYHVQPVSKDKAGNQIGGSDKAAIIGRPTDNVITIILSSLQKTLGF